jgi:superfamily II RNA helicase
MVVLRDFKYDNDSEYGRFFDKYPYSLSSFQKHAIEGIVDKHHVLVTAHTGSGKTLPAEFAIEHLVSQGKKVIYTSPIKALSNQKFYEFCNKYPHISFGLFTGDIKTNPEADVLIMTTEILMNRLFNHSLDEKNETILQFQMDFDNELAAVIFDEVHYINDTDRGQVWEKTILMLPDHVQMIMLSATMDKPERFATWIENNHEGKKVYVCPTNHRVVPLSHYGYMAMGEHEFKQIKDKSTQQQMRKSTGKPIMLKDHKGKFYVEGYNEVKRVVEQVEKQRARINRKFVLNNLVKYLRDNIMLPAIFFVFSRKNVELCAKELTIPLLEEDSKIPHTVNKEAKQILRRLPNHEEYMNLPEYIELIALLEKGIGIHHSGMIPILREIVELFISKKYIKVLFATESFAIGLDCPIKTTVFTSVSKFDGDNDRDLHSHEYTQMAGRAGRRGIDKVGYVIHCNNLFRKQPTENEYKTLMGGKPPLLISKFKVDYSLVLNVLKSNPETTIETIASFIQKSMMNDELNIEIKNAEAEWKDMVKNLEQKALSMEMLSISKEMCDQYRSLTYSLNTCQQKKRKHIHREIDALKDKYQNIEKSANAWISFEDYNTKVLNCELNVSRLKQYVNDQVLKLCKLLTTEGFVTVNDNNVITTNNGTICSHIAEVHGPIWIKCMIDKWNYFEEFTSKQLVGLFSCATSVKVNEEFKSSIPQTDDSFLKARVIEMKEMHDYYETEEGNRDIRSGIRYNESFNYSIIEESMKWCDCKSEVECKTFISDYLMKKGISLGDFTKAILKIATIAKELRGLYELEQCNSQTEWLYKLTNIEEMVLKYIATNQSLYV